MTEPSRVQLRRLMDECVVQIENDQGQASGSRLLRSTRIHRELRLMSLAPSTARCRQRYSSGGMA